MKFISFLFVTLLASITGCTNGCDRTPIEPPTFTPVLPDPAGVGTLRINVQYEGAVPKPKLEPIGGSPECSQLCGGKLLRGDLLVKEGRLQNAFVHIQSGLDPKYRFPIPKEETVIANEKCTFVPRISGARTWQTIRLVNHDPTQHNFRCEHWSHNLNSAGQYALVQFTKPQTMVQLRCDLHAWMAGYVGVLDHPFFAVSDEQGLVTLSNVPAGDYTLQAWHETLGTQSAKANVKAGETTELTVTFVAPN